MPNRRILLSSVAAVACLASACSSSKAGGGSTTTSSAPTTLAKAALVQQLNDLCGTTLTQVKALPQPSGPTDYAAITDYVAKAVQLHGQFMTRATALVAQSADKAELTAKFLAPEASDFAATTPLFTQLAAAAKAKNQAKVSAASDKLGAVTDHSAQIAAYLTSYGLTSCAKLETS